MKGARLLFSSYIIKECLGYPHCSLWKIQFTTTLWPVDPSPDPWVSGYISHSEAHLQLFCCHQIMPVLISSSTLMSLSAQAFKTLKPTETNCSRKWDRAVKTLLVKPENQHLCLKQTWWRCGEMLKDAVVFATIRAKCLKHKFVFCHIV